MSGFFFQVFSRWGRVKSEFFHGGETRKLGGILPEKHAILRVKKFKNLFLSKISGGEKSISGGGEFSPLPYGKKNPAMCTVHVVVFFIILGNAPLFFATPYALSKRHEV